MFISKCGTITTSKATKASKLASIALLDDDLIKIDPTNTTQEVKVLEQIAEAMLFYDYPYSKTYARGGKFYIAFEGRKNINMLSPADRILFRNTYMIMNERNIKVTIIVSDATSSKEVRCLF